MAIVKRACGFWRTRSEVVLCERRAAVLTPGPVSRFLSSGHPGSISLALRMNFGCFPAPNYCSVFSLDPGHLAGEEGCRILLLTREGALLTVDYAVRRPSKLLDVFTSGSAVAQGAYLVVHDFPLLSSF